MRVLRMTFAVTAATALLQIVAGSALGGTAVLCITADGRATLEVAVPGTGRCGDAVATCELGGAEHGCRDLPVISLESAVAAPPHGSDALPATAVLLSATARLGAAAALALPVRATPGTAPPGSAALRRLTVLQV